MKIMVIIAVVIMMLIGGSFSVLKALQIGPFAPEPEHTEEPVSPTGPPVFIDLDPLIINIFEGDSAVTSVQISVKLQVLGADNATLVNQNIPKITDTFLRDLHGFLPRIMKNNDSSIDIFVIKKRLKLTADRLYPDKRINDVLIQSVSGGS